MVERKQDSMNDAFLFSLMQKQLEEEGEIDELTGGRERDGQGRG